MIRPRLVSAVLFAVLVSLNVFADPLVHHAGPLLEENDDLRIHDLQYNSEERQRPLCYNDTMDLSVVVKDDNAELDPEQLKQWLDEYLMPLHDRLCADARHIRAKFYFDGVQLSQTGDEIPAGAGGEKYIVELTYSLYDGKWATRLEYFRGTQGNWVTPEYYTLAGLKALAARHFMTKEEHASIKARLESAQEGIVSLVERLGNGDTIYMARVRTDGERMCSPVRLNGDRLETADGEVRATPDPNRTYLYIRKRMHLAEAEKSNPRYVRRFEDCRDKVDFSAGTETKVRVNPEQYGAWRAETVEGCSQHGLSEFCQAVCLRAEEKGAQNHTFFTAGAVQVGLARREGFDCR